MGNEAEFECYLEHLCKVLGRTDRRLERLLPWVDVADRAQECRTPLAACADPFHVASKHQSLVDLAVVGYGRHEAGM